MLRIHLTADQKIQISTNSEMKTYGLRRAIVPLLMVWLINCCTVLAEDHPYLNDPDLPDNIDKRNILVAKCSHYTADKYQYKNFTRLSDIPDINPSGFILRMPIYVQGERDALIKFSTRKNPAPNADVYEIVLGEYANKHVIIRRKQGYTDLVKEDVGDVLATDQPTKFVIEITNDGDIRVFSEVDKSKPLATAHDDRVLHVKYMSLAVYEPNSVEFFYNCDI